MISVRGGVADHVKVLDFGRVKDWNMNETNGLSVSGALVGTPAYLPPEALTDPSKIDARSDLYAVGAVAYFLLTGAHVFEGATVIEICSQHIYCEPLAPSLRAGVAIAPGLERLVLRCLAKEPAARPASAAALAEELLALENGGAWSPRQGREWWDTHGARMREAIKSGRRKGSLPGSSTVAVDLRERVPPPNGVGL